MNFGEIAKTDDETTIEQLRSMVAMLAGASRTAAQLVLVWSEPGKLRIVVTVPTCADPAALERALIEALRPAIESVVDRLERLAESRGRQ